MSRRDSPLDLLRLVPMLLASRRKAVADGELARMWPGALLDIATTTWWRGIYWPIVSLIYRGPGPDERHHSPDGTCPHCNPNAPINQAAAVIAAHTRIEHSSYRCRCLATWDDTSAEAHASHVAHELHDAGLLP